MHGFLDTWRVWELVLPQLERHHEVFAPTLAGHAGGPPLPARLTDDSLADELERAMDAAGVEAAHLVGNSLGGFVALQLAARGRAVSVVALAPAGGWQTLPLELFERQRELVALARRIAPHVDALVSSAEGRRRATALITTNYEHIPAELIAHELLGIAHCGDAETMLDFAARAAWSLEVERIECPVRILWGSADQLLTWPEAASRYRRELAHVDWVELDGLGHCLQLDAPAEVADLILGLTR